MTYGVQPNPSQRKVRQLKRELWLPQPVAEIFPFFADAANLGVLTPPWLKFQILSPRRLEMHVGTPIDDCLRVRGLPMRWQSEITPWTAVSLWTNRGVAHINLAARTRI